MPSNPATLSPLLGLVGQALGGGAPTTPAVMRNSEAAMSPHVQMKTVFRAFNGYIHSNDRAAALFIAIRKANLLSQLNRQNFVNIDSGPRILILRCRVD